MSLGRASAATEEQQQAEPLGATAGQNREALESGTGQTFGEVHTDPQAAAELPHTGLDGGEALQLAEAVFAPELEATAGIFGDLEPERFLSDHAAIAPASSLAGASQEEAGESPETGPGGLVLVESLLPLRTQNEAGKEEAVNLGLEPARGELQPANPLVEVGVPGTIGEGVSLPEPEIGINVEDAPEATAASDVEGSFAFYPETATDTDLIVAPTPQGVETMTIVRSDAAPTQTTYPLSLPPGAELVATLGGGAEVTEGGQVTVMVPPPTALDAAGAAVPAQMKVDGNALTVSITPLPTTDYPVLVDPEYIVETWNWSSRHESLTAWEANTDAPGYKALGYAYWEIFEHSTQAAGLDDSSSPEWGGAGYEGQAWWLYTVPRYKQEVIGESRPAPTSWIAQLTAENVWFLTQGNHSKFPAMIGGLADPGSAGWWKPGKFFERYGDEGDLRAYGGFTETNGGTAPDHATKAADLALTTLEPEGTAKRRDTYIGAAVIALTDPEAPTASLAPPTSWLTGSAPVSIPYSFEDKGLGLIWAELRPAGGGTAQRISATGFDHCYGTVGAPCPRLAKSTEAGRQQLNLIPGQLPTGEDELEAIVEDPLGGAGHTTSRRFPVKVDQTAPTLTVSGTATEQGAVGTGLPTYSVRAHVSDGTAAAPQSGASRTVIKVDGKVADEYSPGCATKNCEINHEWQMESSHYPTRTHTIEVFAYDAVGLQSQPKIWSLELGPTAVTSEPTEINANDALMSGTVQSHGEDSEYFFEYGSNTSYGHIASGGAIKGSDATVDVEEVAIDLAPETTYHYRLLAESPVGTSYGKDRTFTTSKRVRTIQEEEEERQAEEAPLEEDEASRISAKSVFQQEFFGMNWNGRVNTMVEQGDFKAMKDSGAKIYRFGVGENEGMAVSFREAKENGLTPLPYLGEGPFPKSESAQTDFFVFAKRMMREYGPEGSVYHQSVWEMWNEPNMRHVLDPEAPVPVYEDQNFQGNVAPVEFAEFYKKLVLELRSVAPNVELLSPSMFGYKETENGHDTARTFMKKFDQTLKAIGLARPYQGISIHPYVFKVRTKSNKKSHAPKAVSEEDAKQVMAEVKSQIVEVHNQVFEDLKASLPIWVTELGFPVRSELDGKPDNSIPAVDPKEQRILLNATFSMLHRLPYYLIEHAIYYNIHDLPGESWEHHSGLLEEDGAPRGAWEAFRKLAGGSACKAARC